MLNNRMLSRVRELMPYFVTKKGNNRLSGDISSENYVPGSSGWSLFAIGDGEINDVTIRGEMHAGTIVSDEMNAQGGTTVWAKNVGRLLVEATSDTTFTITMEESKSGHFAFAQVGDILRSRDWQQNSIFDVWYTVTSVTDNGTSYSFDVTKNSGSNTTLPIGSIVVNYGTANQGLLFASANLNGSPFFDVRTNTSTPWSNYGIVHARLGRLDALTAYGVIGSDEFGAIYGTDLSNTSPSSASIIMSNKQVSIRNVPLTIHNGTNPTVSLTSTGVFKLGTNIGLVGTTGFTFDASTGDLLVGQIAGNYMKWDQAAGTITFSGALSAATGTFIGAITAGTIDIGGADATSFHVDATGQMWLGNAAYTSAPFKVSAGGTLVATGVNVTGAINASSGSITGKLLMSGVSSAIALGVTPPTSASAGTGIWLDRTGLYGLASNAVQSKLDAASGAIIAGAVTLDSNGVSISAGTGQANRVSWHVSGVQSAAASSYDIGNIIYLSLSSSGINPTSSTGKVYIVADPYSIVGNQSARVEITSGPTGASSILSLASVYSFKSAAGAEYARFDNTGDFKVGYHVLRTSGAGTQNIGSVGTPFDNLYVNTITATTIVGTLTGSEWETGGNATIDANQASATTTVYVVNQATSGLANLDVENNIIVGGTVDGVDIAAHNSSTAQHGAIGAVVGTTNTQTLTNKTLTTPTIASFVNATHNHQSAAGGGTLDHGLALIGLSDVEDHPGYLVLTGERTGASSSSQTFTTGVIDSSLTASRLMASSASKKLSSVATLSSWIAGTTNQLTVTDDGDGSATLSLPQNIHTAATPTFARMTLSQATGTAPLTISSTTVVSNLNADKADGYDFDQDVRVAGTPRFARLGLGVAAGGSDALTVVGHISAESADFDGAVEITDDLSVVYGGYYPLCVNVNTVTPNNSNVGIMTNTPDPQFALDVAGPARAELFIGPHALQLADATMIVHFDGPRPYETDYSGFSAGHMGQVGTESGGVIFRPGKFQKAVQVAEEKTNFFPDPLGHTAWSAWVGSPAISTSNENVWIGSGAEKVVTEAYTNYSGVRHNGVILDNLSTAHTLSFRAWCPAGSVLQWQIQSNGYATLVSGTITGDGDWQYIVASFTSDSSSLTHRFAIGANGTGYDSFTFFVDAVQIEEGDYATPLISGSLGAGHTWDGTANYSSSSRSEASVSWSEPQFNHKKGTICLWVIPGNDNHDSATQGYFGIGNQSYDQPRKIECFTLSGAGASNFFMRLRDDTAYRSTFAYYNLGLEAGVPVFMACTWEEDGSFVGYIGKSDGTFIVGTPVAMAGMGDGWSAGELVAGSGYGSVGNCYIDDLSVINRVLDADEIRAIYESNAPVFAESSVFSFRSPTRSPIWVDEEGLWARAYSGNEALGLYAGDASKSWGGKMLYDSHLLIGNSTAGYVHWRSGVNASDPVYGSPVLEVAGRMYVKDASSFDGAISLGASGGIYQGTGTFASPTTGLKIWNDGGVGRIGGYNSGTVQWYANTDGRLYAGAGAVTLDASGLSLEAGTGTANRVSWMSSGLLKGSLNSQTISSENYLFATASGTDATDAHGRLRLQASPYSIAHKAARIEVASAVSTSVVLAYAETHAFYLAAGGSALATISSNGVDVNNLNFKTNTISSTSGAVTVAPLAGQNLNVSLSTTGDFAVNTDDLYVDTSTGNVGIGTTAPTSKLSIAGTTDIFSTNNPTLGKKMFGSQTFGYTADNQTRKVLQFSNPDGHFKSGTLYGTVTLVFSGMDTAVDNPRNYVRKYNVRVRDWYSGASYPMTAAIESIYEEGGENKITLDVDTSTSTLMVFKAKVAQNSGTFDATSQLTVSFDFTGSAVQANNFVTPSFADGSTTTGNPATQGAVILAGSGGNVGIGGASPSYKLDVAGTGRFTGNLTAANIYPGSQASRYLSDDGSYITASNLKVTGGLHMAAQNITNAVAVRANSTQFDIQNTGGNRKFGFDVGNGRLWIGGSGADGTPSYALHVNGDAYVDDDLEVAGNLTGGWTAPSFNTGWGNYGSGYTSVSYKKFGDMVFVRGLANQSVSTWATYPTIFTLPAGYRPATTVLLACVCKTLPAICWLTIGTDGQVRWQSGGYGDGFISLDGISFSIL